MKSKRILVAATGASGAPLLIKCLEIIGSHGEWESWLIMSRSAKATLKQETDLEPAQVEALADVVLDPEDIGAAPASGTFRTEGMLVVPCSMKTTAGIANGYSDNLILRAADVTIKEQRPLVLSVRESPLSPIHLRNMLTLSSIPGVRIVPPMISYYSKPETIDDLTCQLASRLLEPFGIDSGRYQRWTGM